MWMTLLHRRLAHLDEARAGAQLLDVPGAAVAHPRPKSADELIDERGQRPLVRHPALDALRHQLVPPAVALTVAVLRAGDHGADGPHPAIHLEAASLVDDRLPRALGQPGQEAAHHDAMGARGHGLRDVAGASDAAVRDYRHRAGDAFARLVNGRNLRPA